MNEVTLADRPAQPDWQTLTAEGLVAYREAENRVRASRAARAVLGEPDPGAVIEWQRLPLPGRELPVRVHRPAGGQDGAGGDGRAALPFVLHVHGGGFVGTATQCDWVTSYVAAQLPAVVVSVDHRLVDHTTPLAAAVDDGWDVLRHVLAGAEQWGVDPARVAVFGESCGGLICALTAIRAREAGLRLAAQVLVNPAVDVTGTMLDHPSVAAYGDSPMLTASLLRFFRQLAVPPGADARAVSPLYADDLSGLAPALVEVPTADPIADHGRRYAERLREAGTSAQLIEHPGAGHGFLSMPGAVPQAEPARAEIFQFLRASFEK